MEVKCERYLTTVPWVKVLLKIIRKQWWFRKN